MKTSFKIGGVVRFKTDSIAFRHMEDQAIPEWLAGMNVMVSQLAPAGMSVVDKHGAEWHLSSFRIPETVERSL